MSLKAKILDFIATAKRSAGYASDPAVLRALEQGVLADWDNGWVTQVAPNAPLTWELGVQLLGSEQTSERQILRLPMACEIVGFFPTIEVLTTGGAITPTISSIDVAIDVNNEEYKTNAQGSVLPPSAGGQTKDGTFVSLGAISVMAPRLLGLRFTNDQAARTDLGMTFRWKQAANTYKDTIVRVAAFARPLR